MARPSYTLLLKPQDGSRPANKIGVAWENEGNGNKYFKIVLDPGVHLDWRDCEDCYVTLVPARERDPDQDLL